MSFTSRFLQTFAGSCVIAPFLSTALYGGNLAGKVIQHESGMPVKGAKIIVASAKKTLLTNAEGRFSLTVPNGTYPVQIIAAGFSTLDTILTIADNSEATLALHERTVFLGEDVAVIGNRMEARSNIETPVPVDIISGEQLRGTGQTEVAQALTLIAPSFRSGRQTFADGTDHSDPAMLRGLGPDQTLVLINGKRRHTSSLVNVTPIVGRGSVGTDLNAIPIAAVERIEILRDGAAALYGSDAIGGVINIVLKNDSTVTISGLGGQTTEGDGQTAQASFSGGWNIGTKGFLQFTGEIRRREATNRSGTYQGLIYRTADQDGLSTQENRRLDDSIISARGKQRSDYDLLIGNSAQTNGALFINGGFELSEQTEAYFFGGISRRESRAPGFYRFPNEARNNTDIYPDGFMPFLAPTINDRSISAGIRGTKNEWNYDLSSTYGANSFDFSVENSLNRALGNSSPTRFYAGSLFFAQHTNNFDVNRSWQTELFGNNFAFNLAFGAEARFEQFEQTAGEEASWQNGDNSFVPGAQGFPGFRPDYARSGSRTSAAAYTELTSEFSDDVLITLASRYENFSDFGSSLSWRAAGRWNVLDNLALRGAFGTGFRAPSLHQRFFTSASTIFIPVDAAGTLVPFDVVTPTNDSRLARAFGIESLKQERSTSMSGGITARPIRGLTITADVYSTDVDDRIVLTGYLSRLLPEVSAILNNFPDVIAAQFFTNAIDTRSQGIDIVAAYTLPIHDGSLDISAAATFAETTVRAIRIPSSLANADGISEAFFGREEVARIERGQPQQMLIFSVGYSHALGSLTVRATRVGEVGSRWAPGTLTDQDYSAKWLTDIHGTLRIWDGFSLIAGVQNIFNVYPDENVPENQSFGRFRYNTAVTQFGFNGASFYTGLEWKL